MDKEFTAFREIGKKTTQWRAESLQLKQGEMSQITGGSGGQDKEFELNSEGSEMPQKGKGVECTDLRLSKGPFKYRCGKRC